MIRPRSRRRRVEETTVRCLFTQGPRVYVYIRVYVCAYVHVRVRDHVGVC